MQTRTVPKRISLWQGEPLILVARVTSAGGTPVLIAQVTSVSVSIFDMHSATQADPVYSSGSIEPDTLYYDTLQTDDYSNLLGDSEGYNFRYVLDPDTYAFVGSKRYRVQVASLIGASSHMQIYDVMVGEVF